MIKKHLPKIKDYLLLLDNIIPEQLTHYYTSVIENKDSHILHKSLHLYQCKWWINELQAIDDETMTEIQKIKPQWNRNSVQDVIASIQEIESATACTCHLGADGCWNCRMPSENERQHILNVLDKHLK